MKLWKFLFGGCDHKWEIIDRANVTQVDDWNAIEAMYTRYHLQCKHCGNLKVKDMK
jgi:hypothetical protein